jgi:hypothetical protein
MFAKIKAVTVIAIASYSFLFCASVTTAGVYKAVTGSDSAINAIRPMSCAMAFQNCN